MFRELLRICGQRLDLPADLKRLTADYQREKSARPPFELKRLELLAAERQDDERSRRDALLGIAIQISGSSRLENAKNATMPPYIRPKMPARETQANARI